MEVEFDDLDPIIFPKNKKNCASCKNIDKKNICARIGRKPKSAIITLCENYTVIDGVVNFKKKELCKPVVKTKINDDNCRNCLHVMYDPFSDHYVCCIINGVVGATQKCKNFEKNVKERN